MEINKRKKPRKPCVYGALIALFVCLQASVGYALPYTARDLMSLCGFQGPCADTLVSGSAALANDAYLIWNNAAGSATINVLKVDSGDETILNADTGDGVHLQIAGDAQRVLNYTAASDTALVLTFGDGTASQQLDFRGSSADAADSQAICISGAGSCNDATRGSWVLSKGNEVSGGGDLELSSGNASNSDINLNLGSSTSVVAVRDSSTNLFAAFDPTSGSGGLRFASAYGLRFAAYVPTLAATPAAGTNDFKIGYNAVPTAAANAGALLPASPTQGDIYEIANTGPNSISVYPGSGDAINAGTANQRLVVPTLNTVRCIANSASLWYCSLNAAPTPQA